MAAAATYLGLARRALDEARQELQGKTERFTQRPLLQHASIQRSLEAAEGLWFACRAGMRGCAAALAARGQLPDPPRLVNPYSYEFTGRVRCGVEELTQRV